MSQIWFRDEATGDWFVAPATREVMEFIETFCQRYQSVAPTNQHIYLDFEDDLDGSEIRDYFEVK